MKQLTLVAAGALASRVHMHKMDEYDEVFTYLESGTYPEGLSKMAILYHNNYYYHDLG